MPLPTRNDRLNRPFKCPGAVVRKNVSDKPCRKRRKIDYKEACGADDVAWNLEARSPLSPRNVNKFPVYQVKDKETQFRQRFCVPFVNRSGTHSDGPRPAPTLGMRRGASFVTKPLHDPSGEFAIVLYDPTVDDKPNGSASQKPGPEEPPKLRTPLMHKSLAEILGIKKEIGQDRPKLPIVIDPKLAKVLRPHQIEGVKVGEAQRGCCTLVY